MLPDLISYHWITESARFWIKGAPLLSVPEIGLKLPIGRDDIAIDCGANVGFITSKLARTGATVYAFEPNPYCFAILTKRFWPFRKVVCFNAGVMDRACRLTLRVPAAYESFDTVEASTAASFEDVLETDRYVINDTDVGCIDLAQFIISLGRRVRFVKLDIEGSEIKVLNRMIDTRAVDLCDLVVVETHERLSSALREGTIRLRERLRDERLETKIRLDWP